MTVNVGAEITDINLRQLNTGAKTELHRNLVDRKVMVIRDQDLTPNQYLMFMRLVGHL